MFSIPHMIVLFVVVLVVFGPQKLPELARGLGKLMAEFRKASTDFKMAFEEEMRNIERQARETERKKALEAAAAAKTETSEAQPATQGTPPGAETIHSEPIATSTETAEAGEQERLTEGSEELKAIPVPEAIPRTAGAFEEPASPIPTEPTDA